MPELRLHEIQKRYGESPFALQSVDLTIEEGELFMLLGPSGCGKTTLLKLVAGLLAPDNGDVFLGAQKITSFPAEKRGFGMVFQQALLFPHMSVEENVSFGLKMKGISKKERLQTAREMLESVGLAGFGHRHTTELSGGQQQRVSLARALVSNPCLLLMDEPFSALDPELREEMRDLVGRLHQEHRVTILFVTHDREEAFVLADRMGVMKEGRLLQVGSPQDLYMNPCDPNVASFLGAKNVIAGEVHDGMFISDDSNIRIKMTTNTGNQRGSLVMRPEIFQVVKRSEAAEAAMNTSLKGVVKQAAFRQGFYHLKVEVGSHMFDVMQQPGENELMLPGDSIFLSYDLMQVRFIPER